MKIPFSGWFGTNKEGNIIAICFKRSLSNDELKLLEEWWKSYNARSY